MGRAVDLVLTYARLCLVLGSNARRLCHKLVETMQAWMRISAERFLVRGRHMPTHGVARCRMHAVGDSSPIRSGQRRPRSWEDGQLRSRRARPARLSARQLGRAIGDCCGAPRPHGQELVEPLLVLP